MVRGIDHIEIIVRDLDAYVEFLQRLGFEVLLKSTHHEGSVELRLPGENQPIFEIHQVIGEENPGINHIAFSCDDVASAYDSLSAQGVRFQSEPHPVRSTGRFNANLRDPDGWRMQLVDSKRGSYEKFDSTGMAAGGGDD